MLALVLWWIQAGDDWRQESAVPDPVTGDGTDIHAEHAPAVPSEANEAVASEVASGDIPWAQQLQAKPVRPVPVPSVQPQAAERDQASEAPTPDQQLAKHMSEVERSGEIDVLKNAYEGDSADSESGAVERDIRGLLARAPVAQDVLEDISCHRRVCRVRVSWPEQEPTSLMAIHMILGVEVNPQVGIEAFGEPDQDGNVAADLYVLRPGLSGDAL